MSPTCPLPPGRTIRRWVLMPADSSRGMILHTSFCESNRDSVRFKDRIQCNAATKFGSQFEPSQPLNLQQISFEANATADTPVWRASVGDEKTRGCRTKLYLRLDSIQP